MFCLSAFRFVPQNSKDEGSHGGSLRVCSSGTNDVHVPHNGGLSAGLSGNPTGKVQSYSSAVTCQHLCQIIYFGPVPFQALASSCLVEIFSHLTNVNLKNHPLGMHNHSLLEGSESYLKTVTMILQGASLGKDDLTQANASFCLTKLLTTTCFTSRQKDAVQRSAWFHLLAVKLLENLGSPDGVISTTTEIGHSASVLLAILQVSPPYAWLHSAFNTETITNVIRSTQRLQEVGIVFVCLFTTLLESGFLEGNQVKLMQDVFQVMFILHSRTDGNCCQQPPMIRA